jgi:hypothetical protein
MTFAGMSEGMIPFPRKRVVGREDEASIWSVRANWSVLTSIDDPRDGDQVAVTDVDGNGSAGVARWSTADEEWQLHSVVTTTLARLTGITRPIMTGAIAGVGSGAASALMRYVYDGAAWVRVAAGQAVVWTSTLASAAGVLDPSGVGIARVGDLLVITLADGIVTLRLHQFASGETPNATARLWWVDARLPATGLVLVSYMIGNENVGTVMSPSDTQLQAQGWPTITRTNSTITASSGEIIGQTTAANGNVVIQASPTITANTRVAVQGFVRNTIGASGSGTALTYALTPYIRDGANAVFYSRFSSSTSGTNASYFWDPNLGATNIASGANRDSTANYPTTTAGLQLLRNPGNTQLSDVTMNGRLAATGYRNTVNPGTDAVGFAAVSGSTATLQALFALSHIAVITYGTA